MHSLRHNRAAAQIRSLASLDTGGPQLLPLLTEQLGRLLAFDSAAYYHIDADGRPQMLSEDPDVLSMVPTYLDACMQAAEREVARPFATAVREDFGPQMRAQLVTVPYRRFLRSDYYNVLLRPIRIHDCVSLVTRLPDGRATGALKFYRRTGCAGFRRDELTQLAQLEPFLASALQPRASAAPDAQELQQRAVLVLTVDGRLLWLSAAAESLMSQAFGARWRRLGQELPAPLSQVLQRLRQVGEGAALPRLQWRDARGAFAVQARRLEAAQGAGEAVIVEIEQFQQRRTGMLRRLAQLDLPPRQFEIACHLTGPHTEARIAQRLGISVNTLVYHRRRLYERLGVQGRRELVEQLATGAAA